MPKRMFRVDELRGHLEYGFTPEQARDQMGLSKGYFRDIMKQATYNWTSVRGHWTGDRFELQRKVSGPEGVVSDWEAVNGPLKPVTYPPEYVERLQSALEGECEGLAITEEQADAILRWVFLHKD